MVEHASTLPHANVRACGEKRARWPRNVPGTATTGSRVDPAAVARRPSRPCNQALYAELCRAADPAVALMVLVGCFLVANVHELQSGYGAFLLPRLSLANVAMLGGFVIAWHTSFLLFGLYSSAPRPLRADVAAVAAACSAGAVFTLIFPLQSETGAFGFMQVAIAWPVTIAATLATRYGLRRLAERAGSAPAQRVLIVGSGPLARRAYQELADDPTRTYQLIGLVDTADATPCAELGPMLLGPLDGLEQLLMHTVVDEVVIALPIKSQYAQIQRAIEECERAGVQSRYSADVFPVRLARPRVDYSRQQPLVMMVVVTDDWRRVVKRLIDVLGASAAILVLMPVLLLIAIAIRGTSRGPVLYAQERYGWHKRRFRMLKFRTMVENAEALQAELEACNEAHGPLFKIRCDPRITPLGRFLRRTSLDELPQLWNVLRGEMSLVGPRPLPVRDVSLFNEAGLMRRFSVAPGITGLWQISGRSNLSFEQCAALDLRYIDAWSLTLDFSILLRTLPVVVKMTGAS